MAIITAGTTGVELAARKPWRTSLNIENRSTSATIYVDTMTPTGITATNAAIRLAPGECCQITEIEDGDTVYDQWSVIADAGGVTVAVFEGYRTEKAKGGT